MLARTFGPEGGLIGSSHIDWRRERVLAKMLDPKEVDCEIPYWLEKRTKHFLQGCDSLSLVDVF